MFRDLGLPAAFVYEALEHAKSRLTGFEIAKDTGMARSTVYEALETLAAFNLVEQQSGRWSVVPSTSLVALAESLGCAAEISERLAAHRVERAAFRRVMKAVNHYTETMSLKSSSSDRQQRERAFWSSWSEYSEAAESRESITAIVMYTPV